MEDMFRQFADEWGPAKIIHLYEPRLPLKAIVVIDNVALGPAVGGVRMAPDVTTEEVFRLARTMTWKNAAAGLPHGGAKAGIVADPAMPLEQKERLIRAFAQAIADLTEYIPGPDMGTDETCMAFIYDETRRSTGRPKVTGGIPLDELGATGIWTGRGGRANGRLYLHESRGGAGSDPGFRQCRQSRCQVFGKKGLCPGRRQ